MNRPDNDEGWLCNVGKLIPDSTKLSSKVRELASRKTQPYIGNMELINESVFVAQLTTIGRKSGEPRTVELRLVYANGCFYATTSQLGTKHWCQNMIKNPAVEVRVGGRRFSCAAKQVTDEKVRRRILTLRDSPALLDRVVFEMAPR